MTTETMTLHKALSELKVLDSRILGAISGATFVKTNRHSNKKIFGSDIATFEKGVKEDFQKISDLIKRRNAIKAAVSKSNAETIVKINDVEYSIAVAIEMKNHGIELKNVLLNTMESQYNKAVTEIEKNNSVLPENADRYIAQLFGDKEKIDAKVVEEARKTYTEANTLDMIDPLGVKTKIDALKDEIDSFVSEVDSALSVSNATTYINVEY